VVSFHLFTLSILSFLLPFYLPPQAPIYIHVPWW
jgi:hypothetical protein